MKTKTYNFKIKELKELGFNAVVLNDDTHIIFYEKKIILGYPKNKFVKIFEKQKLDKTKKYLYVEFNEIELKAIMKGISMFKK